MMLVVALSMLFLAALLNLIAIQYAQGVVRAALDEGVRVGSVAHGTERVPGWHQTCDGRSAERPPGRGIDFACRSRWTNGGVGRRRIRWLVSGDALVQLLYRHPGREGIDDEQGGGATRWSWRWA